MSFILKFKDIEEKRELKSENYTIRDLLKDLNLSTQTIVAKQNGELSIEDNILNYHDL